MFSRNLALASFAAMALTAPTAFAAEPPAPGKRDTHKKIASRYDGATIRALGAQRGCGVAFMKARKRAERLASQAA